MKVETRGERAARDGLSGRSAPGVVGVVLALAALAACDGGSLTGTDADADADSDSDADLDGDAEADLDLDAEADLDLDAEADLDLDAELAQDADPEAEAEADVEEGPCPADMALVGASCMDLYEAPNFEGASPLVMYTFIEAEAWCTARGRRLCFDDEWQDACEGPEGNAYPYGAVRIPGQCNDEELWRVYNQTRLNAWPSSASAPSVDSLEGLFAAARAVSAAAADSAAHVEELYQGEPSGENAGCVGAAGVYDLVGNVEEWTRRRDGGTTDFHGALKGRYWAESRTCQSRVTAHGDGFRFYEIGFRCCLDAAE